MSSIEKKRQKSRKPLASTLAISDTKELRQDVRGIDDDKVPEANKDRASTGKPAASSYVPGLIIGRPDSEKREAAEDRGSTGTAKNANPMFHGPANDLTIVYGHGRIQRMALFVATLSAFVLLSHNLLLSVVARPVNHWCKQPLEYANMTSEEWRQIAIPRDASGDWHTCVRYDPPLSIDAVNRTQVPCEEWDYDLEGRSIVTYWNLVCEHQWLVAVASVVYMGGAAAAVPIMGQLSDKMGRRPVIYLSVLSLLISGTAICFVNSFTYFVALRFWVSASVSTIQITSFVLLIELSTPSRQCLYGVIAIATATIAAQLYLKIVGYFVYDWVLTQLVVMLPTSLLLSTFLLTVESPRWLLATFKFKVAERLIMWMAQMNGLSIHHAQQQWRLYKLVVGTRVRGYSVAEMLCTSVLGSHIVIVFWCWFVVMLAFYGPRGSHHLSNIWMITAVLVSQVIGAILVYLSMTRRGQRVTLLALLLGLSALAGMKAAMADFQQVLFLELPVDTGADIVFDMTVIALYAYSVELFPTVIRSMGLCAVYFFGRLGAIASTLLRELGFLTRVEHFWGLLSLFGALTALAVYFLPDTARAGDIPPGANGAEKKYSQFARRPSLVPGTSTTPSPTHLRPTTNNPRRPPEGRTIIRPQRTGSI
ncbi:hypothetical protein HPB47_016668 [Ixodes persulcatus]|uniref:Uncharacterized protein n=1 Tax=Ixodes persulcatus TaxID=34615 RepID=A0AC60R1I6_IXOPE|nr:hypothetical protein HPB47_016668 [Ixodes persulcatus]